VADTSVIGAPLAAERAGVNPAGSVHWLRQRTWRETNRERWRLFEKREAANRAGNMIAPPQHP